MAFETFALMDIAQKISEAREAEDQKAALALALDALSDIHRYLQEQQRKAESESMRMRSGVGNVMF